MHFHLNLQILGRETLKIKFVVGHVTLIFHTTILEVNKGQYSWKTSQCKAAFGYRGVPSSAVRVRVHQRFL